MWEHPYADCLCPKPLVVGAGFNVDANQLFPQGVLAAITLVEDVAVDGGYRGPTQGVRQDFLSAQ